MIDHHFVCLGEGNRGSVPVVYRHCAKAFRPGNACVRILRATIDVCRVCHDAWKYLTGEDNKRPVPVTLPAY